MIIGFTGKARSGKDTAAKVLIDEEYTHLSFAGPLKDAVKILFNLEPWQLENKEIVDKRWDRTPRQLLQWLGTDVLRKEFGEDFLVTAIEDSIKNGKKNGNKHVVITDARFDNEAKMIRKNGGKIVQIIRSSQNEGTTTAHSSETGIDDALVDFKVYNDGTIKDLHAQIMEIVIDAYCYS